MRRWLCALLWSALAPLLHAAGIEVVDDRGVTVRWDAPPQRIVTLLPSLTETVHALGQAHRLVGVDRYSNWPAALDRLPRVGGGIDPNVEAIVALRPDVVLLARSSRVVQQLESLGLKVVAEGIETPDQLIHAREAGFTNVQGYLFSRPVPRERIAELIAAGPLAGSERPDPVQRRRHA